MWSWVGHTSLQLPPRGIAILLKISTNPERGHVLTHRECVLQTYATPGATMPNRGSCWRPNENWSHVPNTLLHWDHRRMKTPLRPRLVSPNAGMPQRDAAFWETSHRCLCACPKIEGAPQTRLPILDGWGVPKYRDSLNHFYGCPPF